VKKRALEGCYGRGKKNRDAERKEKQARRIERSFGIE